MFPPRSPFSSALFPVPPQEEVGASTHHGGAGGRASNTPSAGCPRRARIGQDLDRHYRDRRGNRSTHAIKADTLRRSRAGDVLLMAVRADNSKLRSYLVDRILGVKATQTPFTPRYPIELTPLGPQSIPRTARYRSPIRL